MHYIEGIKMDLETADSITRLNLINSLKSIHENIEVLLNKCCHVSLKDHEKEDLKDFTKCRKALMVVIKYYSTPDEMSKLKISLDAALVAQLDRAIDF